MRNRAGIILYSKNKILLIKRIKNSCLYWVAPGGGLKEGESFECAAKRELYEETGLCVKEINDFVTLNMTDGTEKYYIVTVSDTYDARLQGEEVKRSDESNQYVPEWVAISKLNEVNLLPSELKKYIFEYFN